MTKIQDINSAIISGQFSDEQLNSIVAAIKFARTQIVRQNTGSMVIGTKVKFTSSRNGSTVFGVVEKVNRKFIHVREQRAGNLVAGVWRVPANMLSVA